MPALTAQSLHSLRVIPAMLSLFDSFAADVSDEDDFPAAPAMYAKLDCGVASSSVDGSVLSVLDSFICEEEAVETNAGSAVSEEIVLRVAEQAPLEQITLGRKRGRKRGSTALVLDLKRLQRKERDEQYLALTKAEKCRVPSSRHESAKGKRLPRRHHRRQIRRNLRSQISHVFGLRAESQKQAVPFLFPLPRLFLRPAPPASSRKFLS